MRPGFRLTGPGGDLSPLIAPRLAGLKVTDVSGVEADRLEIEIADPEREIELPARGVELELALGFDGRLVEVGRFVVDALAAAGAPDRLTIGARSADLTAELKAPRTREWSETTLGDLVEEIAARHALTPRVAPALADIAIPHLSQTSESDLHLLTRLARRMDAVAKVGGGALLFVRRGAGLTASGRALEPVRIARRETTAWSWRLEDRGSWGSCAAFWQDVAAGERRRVETGDARPQFEIGQTFASEAIARRAAHARLAELRRGGLQLELSLARGRPEILAETPIEAGGFREGVDGRWIAARVEHRLTADGLHTRLSLEPEPAPEAG